jgi:hypothetical protein
VNELSGHLGRPPLDDCGFRCAARGLETIANFRRVSNDSTHKYAARKEQSRRILWGAAGMGLAAPQVIEKDEK